MKLILTLQVIVLVILIILVTVVITDKKRPIVIDVESQGHICQMVLYEDDERVACRIIIEVGMQ